MESEVLADVIQLIEEGVVVDRKGALRPVVAVVGTQRSEREEDVYTFIDQLRAKYPYARLVVGDTSTLERAAAVHAGLTGMQSEIVQKEDDESSNARDEAVVAKSTHVVAFDGSARSKNYKKFADRQLKHFSQV